jgi:hypothetical protein
MIYANKASSHNKLAGYMKGIRQPVTLVLLFFLTGTAGIIRSQEVQINSNLVIESDGTLRMDNTATVWNDLMVYPDATTKGGSNPPSWGVAFKKNSAGTSQGVYLWMFASNAEEELYFAVQIPHDYKIGSDIFPHVHWTTVSGTPSEANVVWGLEYTIVAMGGSFPTTQTLKSGSVIASIGTPSGTGQHLINDFNAIDGTGLGISTVMVCRLYRAVTDPGDTFSNAVGFLGFDIHYEQDTHGSRLQWSK